MVSSSYRTPVINSLHPQNVYVTCLRQRENSRSVRLMCASLSMCIRLSTCRALRGDTPSAWLGHRTHIRAARTEIYAIGCEACIVAFIGGRPVPRVRIERTRTAPSARHHLPIYRFNVPRTRSAIFHARWSPPPSRSSTRSLLHILPPRKPRNVTSRVSRNYGFYMN